MGMDIHMRLVRIEDGFEAISDLYEGRNSEWFNNLMGREYDRVYNKLFFICGLPDFVLNEKDKKAVENPSDYGAFNFQWINAADYIEWYNKYQPQLDAGYVTEYENWAYDHGRYNPFEEGICHYLPENEHGWIFREFIDEYCPDTYVVNKLLKLYTPEELSQFVITMWFDR